MIDNLAEHIRKFIPVSNLLLKRLTEISELKTLEKGKFLHRPNRVCNYTYFINTGLLRIFYKKGDKEVTDNFSAEGEWITSIYSFMKNIPDNFYIQTIEKSELVAISYNNLEKCFKDFPEMERFGRMLISKRFLEQSERIISLQFNSAKERYQFFKQTSKNILPRVPLGMMASHLGMTQETLSRIRSTKGTF